MISNCGKYLAISSGAGAAGGAEPVLTPGAALSPVKSVCEARFSASRQLGHSPSTVSAASGAPHFGQTRFAETFSFIPVTSETASDCYTFSKIIPLLIRNQTKRQE